VLKGAINWLKVAAYCLASSGTGVLVRIGHLYSGGEKITVGSVVIPGMVAAGIMFLGLLSDATKPTQTEANAGAQGEAQK
jgi:hypothetical protein